MHDKIVSAFHIELPPTDQFDSQHPKNVAINRRNLNKIFGIIILLAKQGLTFRGHDESKTSFNKRNFLETVEMACKLDTELQKHCNCREVYLCKKFRNRMISIIVNPVH